MSSVLFAQKDDAFSGVFPIKSVYFLLENSIRCTLTKKDEGFQGFPALFKKKPSVFLNLRQRSTAENEKRLPQYCHLQRGSGNAERNGEAKAQRVCVPLSYWRTDLPGQCAPHAPPGVEARRIAGASLPRPAPHLRHPGPAERCGHQNRLRYAGPLLRRLHPGHLRSCHYICAEGSGSDYGECATGLSIEKNKDFGGVDFYVSDSLLDILILAVKNSSLFQILFIGTCSRKQLIWMKAFSCITACLISSAAAK